MQGEIILASASPRRRELLAQIGVRFRVMPAHIDEFRRESEHPRDLVVRLALEKATACRARTGEGAPVLGADTLVVLGDSILGKPQHEEEARCTLRALSGRTHTVLTAVALVGSGLNRVRVSESAVTFITLTESQIRAYWKTGEPADKAGAYAIQGVGAVFVERLVGSFSGVMGLPLHETAELLSEVGIEIPGPVSD